MAHVEGGGEGGLVEGGAMGGRGGRRKSSSSVGQFPVAKSPDPNSSLPLPSKSNRDPKLFRPGAKADSEKSGSAK